jgi:hypothetical protein
MPAIDLVQKKAGIAGDGEPMKQTFLPAIAAFIIPDLDLIFSKVDVRLPR